MTWFFEGTGTQLSFSLSATGNLSAHGTCQQSCSFQGGDPDIFRYVCGAEGAWSLHSPDAQEHEYDGVGRGLKTFFGQNGGRAAALINYHPQSEHGQALVGASILMPPPAFNEALSLLRAVMGNPQMTYIITLEFSGLSVPEAVPNPIPKVSEFVEPDILSRRAYMSNEVSVTVLTAALAAARAARK